MQAKHPKISKEQIDKLQESIDTFVEDHPDEARSSAAVVKHFRALVMKEPEDVQAAVRNATIKLRFGRIGDRPRLEHVG
jgi:hypothetical protein